MPTTLLYCPTLDFEDVLTALPDLVCHFLINIEDMNSFVISFS